MEWSQSDVLSLAQLSCAMCLGEGTIREKMGKILPCSCVRRGVFRACYARFRVAAEREKYISKVSFDHFGGKDRRLMWSRKEEEYMADFQLISRRSLTPWDHRIFTFHFMLGADWRLCCRRLRLDRGQFFHAIYRVQETLGRVFSELEPYSLYPPKEYFITHVGGDSRPTPAPLGRGRIGAAGFPWVTGLGPAAAVLPLALVPA
jgi:hypothetical protein